MIEAAQFVEQARQRGFGFYAGVPCSYLKPLINYVIGDENLTYISSANEGDAVATAGGAVLGGQRAVAMMQNSGLGNAVSPLASLTWVFRIPVLLIVTWRGDPDLGDEPQHRLMGAVTQDMLDTLHIPWEFFPSEESAVEEALSRACKHMDIEGRPYALVMRKGTVSPFPLQGNGLKARRPAAPTLRTVYHDGAEDQRPTRSQALRRIVDATDVEESLVIATTGYTGRELYALDDRSNQLYMVGSMGCASALGLGLSLVRESLRVVVVDGDGAALMRLGNLATVGAYARANLSHIVLDNEVHDSTGGQQTVSRALSFAGIASSCGYASAIEGDHIGVLDELFETRNLSGPSFAQLKTKPGTVGKLPRPEESPEQVRARFMKHIQRMTARLQGTRS